MDTTIERQQKILEAIEREVDHLLLIKHFTSLENAEKEVRRYIRTLLNYHAVSDSIESMGFLIRVSNIRVRSEDYKYKVEYTEEFKLIKSGEIPWLCK
jgi:hypothetical protein